MRLDALTFDIDRTLVDSNPAHIDLEQLADVIANADDAKQSKPAPDIVAAALRKSRLSPAQCALVGDTLYEKYAAKHAGVIGIGVLTGYQSAQTLKESGARGVYRDVAEIADKLHDVLHRAAPAAVHLTIAPPTATPAASPPRKTPKARCPGSSVTSAHAKAAPSSSNS